MNNVKKFLYFSLTDDNQSFINHEITNIAYKISLNKISKINRIINIVLRQLVNIVTK